MYLNIGEYKEAILENQISCMECKEQQLQSEDLYEGVKKELAERILRVICDCSSAHGFLSCEDFKMNEEQEILCEKLKEVEELCSDVFLKIYGGNE